MASKKRRLTTGLAALVLLSVTFIACGSAVPARPAALDPSNPDGPESPRRSMNRDEVFAPTATESMDASPPAGPHRHGATGGRTPGTPESEIGSQ